MGLSPSRSGKLLLYGSLVFRFKNACRVTACTERPLWPVPFRLPDNWRIGTEADPYGCL